MNAVPAIELRRVCKRYPNGTLANSDVSFEVAQGEIHALVGENGAGKSTVMKMLFGLEQPSAGEILVRGAPVHLRGPRDAMAQRIGLVPQHLQMVPSFSVMQNVVLGAEPTRGLTIDRQRAKADVNELSQRFGLAVDPDAQVSHLSVGEQQRVEILKALYRGADLLLLDEPSALLSPQESLALFDALRKLVEHGHTVVLITHKLAEVREVSDRYTVMRGGHVTGYGRSALVSDDAFAEMIVGCSVPSLEIKRRTRAAGYARLAVRDLTVSGATASPRLEGVNFDIAAGEILGIAGVEGNGQSVLAEALSGLRRPSSGLVTLDGQPCALGNVTSLRRLGVSAISEDRLHDGVAAEMSISENLMAADYNLPPCGQHGWLDTAAMRARAERQLEAYGVVARTPDDPIDALSGGNMQKVVMARELSTSPRLLISSQPTRGVDIGAAQFLRQRIVQLRDAGAAVLLVSSDLDELVALSDRVAVLHKGRIVGHFPADAEPHELGLCMTGAHGDQSVPATLDAPWTGRRSTQSPA